MATTAAGMTHQATAPVIAFENVTRLGIERKAIIDRTRYGVTWNAPLSRGGFAFADDVKLVVSLARCVA